MHATPLDYATNLPVSPRAQLAWLYALQCFMQDGWAPNAAQIADKLGVDESQGRRIVSELIAVGEFYRERPGVLELVAV